MATRRRPPTSAPILGALLLAALAVAHPARADVEETERRLKTAGVPDALRARIHTAIDRGVVWLGQHADPAGRLSPGDPGVTVLGALALRHAGTRVSKAILDRTLGTLFPKDGRIDHRLYDDVYNASLAALLLEPDADPWRRGIAKDAAWLLPGGLDAADGLWLYSTLGREGQRARGARGGSPNLSTSQFACLGIWVGSRLGIPVPRNAWRVHLDRLERMLTTRGGFCYADGGSSEDWRRPYWTGTFMGHADVSLGWAAIGESLPAGDGLRKRLEALRVRADALLLRDGAALLRSLPTEGSGSSPGNSVLTNEWSYYGLWAFEKACVFAGIEDFAGTPWYVRGAEHLLRVQSADGGWRPSGDTAATPPPRVAAVTQPSDVISTSFALLFLLRASEAYRPTTPRPIDTPPPTPTTPSDPTPAPAK